MAYNKSNQNNSPEYRTWIAIRYRCRKPRNPSYKDYGARGVTICDEWYDSFHAFIEHVGPRPGPLHSIDRIDTSKGYEPGNVRWATAIQQANNKLNNVRLTYNGETKSVADWARSIGSPYERIRDRASRGLPIETVLSPVKLSASMNSSDPRRNAYFHMTSRCYNPKNPKYSTTGAIGIKVCSRWRLSFETFCNDMGHKPSPQHALTRLDVNADFCPENCRWLLPGEAGDYRRTAKLFTVNGESMSLTAWSRRSGVDRQTIRRRIDSGWDLHSAIHTPTNAEKRS